VGGDEELMQDNIDIEGGTYPQQGGLPFERQTINGCCETYLFEQA